MHVPLLRLTLTNCGSGAALSPKHEHESWSWVDTAVPTGVSQFAKAVEDALQRADALEGLLTQELTIASESTQRLRNVVQTSIASIVATKGPLMLVQIIRAFFARRLTQFAEKVDELNEDDDKGMGIGDDDTNDTEKEDAFTQEVEAYIATGINKLERQHSLVAESKAGTNATKNFMGNVWVREMEMFGVCLRSDVFGNTCAAAAASAIDTAISKRVSEKAMGNFERKALPNLLKWIDQVPVAFLKTVGLVGAGGGGGVGHMQSIPANNAIKSLNPAHSAIESSNLESAQWRARCAHAAYEMLGSSRVKECFDVIVEFPESKPAVDDLRKCLRRTTLHSKLIDSLQRSLRSRLLIAGAPTADIIDTYRLTIRALRDLDPSGVVLRAVSGELKEYLRKRKDTIRCVVGMLMGKENDEGEGAFQNGLLSASNTGDDGDSSMGKQSDRFERVGDDDGDAEFLDWAIDGEKRERKKKGSIKEPQQPSSNWDSWEPEPVESEAAAAKGRKRTGDDELGQLVSIYGSKEVFIGEYRNMLAERLLSKVGYDVDRETHALELLKLRFGEHNLHKCEVMLKDMRDSKRLNTNIKAPPAPGTPSAMDENTANQTETLRKSPLDATVVSALFWPPFGDEAPDFELPSAMKDLTTTYAYRYHHLKAPRKMNWLNNLGTVQMEIMWRDTEVSVSVGPIEAALIHLFQEKSFWSFESLTEELKIPKQVLRRKAVVWINNGLLLETVDEGKPGYRLVSESDANTQTFGAAAADDGLGSGSGLVASSEDQAAAGMKVYEQYIIGMLTNFPSLPLDRIHNMLKMFVSEPPYDRSSEQLHAFLNSLVAEDKLVMEGEEYKRRT